MATKVNTATNTAVVNHVLMRPRKMGAVFKDIADTYPLFPQVILEQIQNAVDANAERIHVLINESMKLAYVTDNGDGVTPLDFNDSLMSLLDPKKGKDKFGRFARGKVAALTKCRQFIFTSRVEGGLPHRWTFDCKDILESEDFPQIPWEKLAPSSQMPEWKTQVLMKGLFFNDSVKFRVDISELKASILSSFGNKMRTLGTVVSVTYVDGKGKKHEDSFSAKSYTGKPLPLWESTEDTPAGKVSIRLYRSNESSPIPVTIGQKEDPFRLDWKTFYQSVNAFSARSKRITFDGKEINALFRSGVVSGDIECEHITIHPTREKFERNEALDFFVLILQDWFEQVGKKIHKENEIQAKSSLYQQIAIDAIKRIEKHPLVEQFLKSVVFGSVGKGHADTGAKSLGTITAIDVNKGRDKGMGSYDSEKPPQTRNSPSEKVTRPGHVPILVAGNDGNERQVTRKENRGLMVDIAPFQGLIGSDAPLFTVDTNLGMVIINQLAPDFNASADRGDKAIRRYIDMVLMSALQSFTSSDHERSKAELEQYVRNLNQFLLAGDQRTV